MCCTVESMELARASLGKYTGDPNSTFMIIR